MATENNGKTRRVTMDMSPEAYQTLSDLSESLGTSKVEVFRKALGLVKFINEMMREGWTVSLRKDGKVKEIIEI